MRMAGVPAAVTAQRQPVLVAQNTFGFENVEPSCVVMQHPACTEESEVSLVALTAQRGAMLCENKAAW